MAIIAPVAPPTVSPLPTPPSTSDPSNFDIRADGFLGALPTNQSQMNTLGTNVYQNAQKTHDSALESVTASSTATTAANSANNSASTAATNANNAAASYTQMQKLYLGAKTTPPTTDNQGQPLQAGTWYTNTALNQWFWWNGSAWVLGVGDLTTVNWNTQVTNKPTTIAGYGITDHNWNNLGGKPTTVAGFGITDAVTTTSNQTIGGNKTFSGSTVFPSASGSVGTNSSTGSVRMGSITAPAVISFFNGPYGVNMGLDSDNAFRIGGWIQGSNVYRFQSLSNGNLIALGDVTAYSDERLKTDWSTLPTNLIERLAGVKHGTYTRIDTNCRQVGVSAQELKGILPEAVIVDAEGMHSVNYGNASLVIAIELANRVLQLSEELEKLKQLLNKE